MERRAESRFECNQPVQVTVLDGEERQMPGVVQNVSGSGMRLVVECPLPAGAVIKIERENTMLLGEVCYCHVARDGFAIGIRLEHCVADLSDCERLARALFGESESTADDLRPAAIDK